MFFIINNIMCFEFKLKIRNTDDYLTCDSNYNTIVGDFDDADVYHLKATDDPKYYNIIVSGKNNGSMDINLSTYRLYYYNRAHNNHNQKFILSLTNDGAYKILIMDKCLQYLTDENRFTPKNCDENNNLQFYNLEEIVDKKPLILTGYMRNRLLPVAEELKRNRVLRSRAIINRIYSSRGL
ncbi:hypothetical protein DMUE_3181 [Dictyocoela muelleri]|nr:hypothetical protein DMUE_3181 [Dictyocoela muelleri]